MLVEDDDDIRDCLRAFLESEGHEVVTAANGREALAKLGAAGTTSLILLDLFMPIMNGYEFLRSLSGAAAAPPVVVISAASPGNELLRAALELATSHLRKPLDLADVLRVVEEHCPAVGA
jgi:CheY-like chemotaxis protein